ncbi:hypothetical protein [Seinonella peptonophila]|uniref:hypothetical protein n=1 Tax=Seinonella peptonophila TaxID=112248 RepID=UPI001587AB8C|nr:hypothetical protein [Seinonella peptonophila]
MSEISSWLIEADRRFTEERPVHHSWDPTTRASLVILWGLLIYPLLDKDLKQEQKKISVDFLNHLFQEHFGGKDGCDSILALFQRHDYIRFTESRYIVPGTRLFTAVDAARMYPIFRTSLLARRLMKASKDHG